MPAHPPNLLFLFTDEQAAATMTAYGNDRIRTPCLDRLASESVVFHRAYVTQPVCTPSRSTLLTGLYPERSGLTENNLPLRADVPCLPEMGDFSAYRTGYFGKWHLGDEIFPQHGFREWRSTEDGYRRYYTPERDRRCHSTYFHFLLEQGYQPDRSGADGFESFGRLFATRLPEAHSKPAYLAGEARRFIRECAEADTPFVLYVNFLEPHMPFHSQRDGQYDLESVPLPGNFHHEPGEDTPLKVRLFRHAYRELGFEGQPLKTEADWRKLITRYWGLVSLVDTHAGAILDAVDEYGLAERTIIVYTSDHGDMMGSHGLLAKCVMYEEAVRVPLLLKIPGLTLSSGRSAVSMPVSQVDLVPTLLDALGQPLPDGLDGGSWMPFLRGEETLPRDDVFITWQGGNSGLADRVGGTDILDCWRELADEEHIRTAISDPVITVLTSDGWKYSLGLSGERELYNLAEDPLETRNLAGSNGLQGTERRMQVKIRAFRRP